MRSKIWQWGLLSSLALASAALGDVQYTSVNRSVVANGTVWPVDSDTQSQNDTKQSTDAGSFNQTALVNLTVGEDIPNISGGSTANWLTSYATATQNSSLSDQGITESGSLDYYTAQTIGGNGLASSESTLSVTFSVDSELAYTLFFVDPMPPVTATLTDAAGDILNLTNPATGVLMPGEYTLTHVLDYGQAYHDASTPVGYGLQMAFSPMVAVPEPGCLMIAGAASVLAASRRRRVR